MTIDSHHHFWRYHPAEYDWIGEDLREIRQDFGPEHLQPQLAAAGIDGCVTVQARQSRVETGWLLELAGRNDFIRGVVGWVDLRSPDLDKELEHWAAHPKLKGVRHVIQSEPDEAFLLRPDFNRGIRRLRRHNLAYDLLIFEHQLPQTILFADAHPEQRLVLDHLAKPRIREGSFEPWRRNLRELARRPNVYCKVSGLVTEADPSAWTAGQLQPYFDCALESFGARRLMFGSDWPVCLPSCPYEDWHRLVKSWISRLSVDEIGRIMGATAVEAYQL